MGPQNCTWCIRKADRSDVRVARPVDGGGQFEKTVVIVVIGITVITGMVNDSRDGSERKNNAQW